jgi:bifunctional non-homologous end joining protein LigD
VKPKAFSALPPAKIRFIEPMYARLVQSLPQGPEWLYEVKFDGYRCLAGRDEKGVTLWSRRENHFTNQFPHIAQACESLPPNTLIDGEIVALDDSGKVSFNLLQHHRSKAQALVFGGNYFIKFLGIPKLLQSGCRRILKLHQRI